MIGRLIAEKSCLTQSVAVLSKSQYAGAEDLARRLEDCDEASNALKRELEVVRGRAEVAEVRLQEMEEAVGEGRAREVELREKVSHFEAEEQRLRAEYEDRVRVLEAEVVGGGEACCERRIPGYGVGGRSVRIWVRFE